MDIVQVYQGGIGSYALLVTILAHLQVCYMGTMDPEMHSEQGFEGRLGSLSIVCLGSGDKENIQLCVKSCL